MSFSLGRPDTLGLDDYHNRPLPPRDDSQYAIIPWMVDFARITRKVSVQVYHKRLSLEEKLGVAEAIEAELDEWMARLPDWIRPDFIPAVGPEADCSGRREGSVGGGRNDLKDPKWARRQRLVLGIRMPPYSPRSIFGETDNGRILQRQNPPLPSFPSTLYSARDEICFKP